jgi:hypothetical protein
MKDTTMEELLLMYFLVLDLVEDTMVALLFTILSMIPISLTTVFTILSLTDQSMAGQVGTLT